MSEEQRQPSAAEPTIERLREDVTALAIALPHDQALEAYDAAALRQMVRAQHELLERFAQTTQALQESEERYRLLVSAVEDYAIFMLDPQGHILSWNQGAQRIKGYSAAEIMGQHFSRFYLPEEVAAGKPLTILTIAAEWGHYAEEGWRVRKDGSRFWASVIITAIRDASGQLRGFGKVTRDLTERKVAEETLRQSEERFRLLIEGVRDYAIFMLTTQGYVASWNAGAQLIKGYTASEIVGKHFALFYPAADVEAGKPAWELEVAQRDGRYEEEGWRMRKDGSLFWASVLITALYDATGQLRGFGKVTRDLTEHKRAEEEREALRLRELDLEREREAREQVQQALQIRDRFFAIASHELKTPLTTLVMSAQLQQRRLARYPELPAAEHERAQTVYDQAMRLNRLVNSLLDLTRIQEQRLSLAVAPVDLVALTQRLVGELRPTLLHHQLDVRLPDAPVIIQGDQERLEQVVQNLLQNAVKFSPAGGRLDITLEVADQQACLAITDPGIGIAPDELPRIFDQLYRGSNLEPQQLSGMGVGLYVAQSIIALHGGRIDVTSQVGRGSRFCVFLPSGAGSEAP
jgi:PAS domain S-box-containing protein